MIDLNNIRSVTDFQRNPKGVLATLKTSKKPIVLTVNGKAELVVQDAESYQELLDKVKSAEDMEAVRQGLQQSLTDEGRAASDFFHEFENQNGL